MAQVKVRVTNAIVGGHRHGEEILVDEAFAKMVIDRGYAEKVEDAEKSFTTVRASEYEAKDEKEAPKKKSTKKSDK